MNLLHSTMDVLRDKYLARVTHTSTFRATGQITPEEFLAAGDFLAYKFPSWSWADASSPARRVAYLPPGKQFLVTRGVPCRRRLDADFAGEAGRDETLVRDGFERRAYQGEGEGEADDDGWLRTGNMAASQEARMKEVRTVDEMGEVGEREDDDDEIPDMEDDEDDDEAIIRDRHGDDGPLRHYTLYITYSPYYKTPRLYLSGYRGSTSEPIPPTAMFEDIVGDYKDKTVTLEDFGYLDAGVKMASVHPCRHASVMKVLLDRADAALKLRMERIRQGKEKQGAVDAGMEALVLDADALKLGAVADKDKDKAVSSAAGDEWEEVHAEGEDEVAIRVDQYLVVFLKFIASVTPGIEHDFTMGV